MTEHKNPQLKIFRPFFVVLSLAIFTGLSGLLVWLRIVLPTWDLLTG